MISSVFGRNKKNQQQQQKTTKTDEGMITTVIYYHFCVNKALYRIWINIHGCNFY